MLHCSRLIFAGGLPGSVCDVLPGSIGPCYVGLAQQGCPFELWHLTLLDVFMPPCTRLGRATEVVAHAPYLDYLDLSFLRNSGCICTLPPEQSHSRSSWLRDTAAGRHLFGKQALTPQMRAHDPIAKTGEFHDRVCLSLQQTSHCPTPGNIGKTLRRQLTAAVI